jgi:hypothetical protein
MKANEWPVLLSLVFPLPLSSNSPHSALWNAGFIESSAKTNKNVNELFLELVRMIDKWRKTYTSTNTEIEHKEKKKICVIL